MQRIIDHMLSLNMAVEIPSNWVTPIVFHAIIRL